MKRTSLRDILLALEEERYQIEIKPEIAERAVRSLDEMLKYV
jgi:quinolinate synthase